MHYTDIINKFRFLFDWMPVSVSYPAPKYYEYRDVGRVLLGYRVCVRYAHHGIREYLFTNDEEKLGLVTKAQALNNAIKFYERIQQKIKGK